MEQHQLLGDKGQDGNGINDGLWAGAFVFMPEALGRFRRPKASFVK